MNLIARFGVAETFSVVILSIFLGFSGEVSAFGISSTPRSLTSSSSGSALRPQTVLFSSEETSDSQGPEEAAPDQIPRPVPTPPPPVPQKRLDPLMASLTRVDPAFANGPTRNIPIFGEVPVDGSLVVLVPAVVIGILGFVLSIVVAVNSQDELVRTLSQVPETIAQQATENTNRVYDPNVCRGLCSAQEKDLDGLRSFMESLRK